MAWLGIIIHRGQGTFDNEYDKERNNSTIDNYNYTAVSNSWACNRKQPHMQPTHASTFCGLIKLGKCQFACRTAKYIICTIFYVCFLLHSLCRHSMSLIYFSSIVYGIVCVCVRSCVCISILLSQYFHCIRFGNNDTINTFIFMHFFLSLCTMHTICDDELARVVQWVCLPSKATESHYTHTHTLG